MPRAVTRHGLTTIYGPGAHIAGTFATAEPLDDSPASRAEAQETDDTLRACWLRTLERHEATITAALAEGPDEAVTRLYADVERTAHAQVQLATLDGIADDVLQAGGIATSERNRAFFRRLVLGGRDERTWRRWVTGEQLVPEAAADYLSRVRACRIEASAEPDGAQGRRLVIELVLDD